MCQNHPSKVALEIHIRAHTRYKQFVRHPLTTLDVFDLTLTTALSRTDLRPEFLSAWQLEGKQKFDWDGDARLTVGQDA